ncbi:NAD-dependent epimerase/dehydratase family protein [Pseudanabaena sp. FACHB-1998]|uniref:NAD-dependent epimerase/dehydratase family protein n=1 Tax=Pseudanabaena sp. FACHB-1998 TaxID=2692858 RepID=UPI0016801799|nr:NAD-dependent epimerase/dehydratase family protein [Pseudanabaena sp. FACHB-1998]MBD2176637.1 NAD-dependent epimerase/dehydratase family protein [Pseudanabaena sp. FACHB-1998]
MINPLASDLDHILSHTYDLWEEVREKQVFITGGTGFFGCWLLESFIWANDKLELNSTIHVLTRNIQAFTNKAPHLASHPAIKFHFGDVTSFEFPDIKFSHVIHAATEVNVISNCNTSLEVFNTITEGTKHILDLAIQCETNKLLLTSSGAVYGKQPSQINYILEDYQGSPDLMDFKSGYAQGKRVSEFLCNSYANKHGFEVKIARCFAFIGAYLSLDSHLAIASFIKAGLNESDINIQGDGTTCRSYLYMADLAIWLWTILFKGENCYPYNVGSDKVITIAELANLVSKVFGHNQLVTIAKEHDPNQPIERYVPSIQRAFDSLNLKPTISIEEAIMHSINWYSHTGARYV